MVEERVVFIIVIENFIFSGRRKNNESGFFNFISIFFVLPIWAVVSLQKLVYDLFLESNNGLKPSIISLMALERKYDFSFVRCHGETKIFIS